MKNKPTILQLIFTLTFLLSIWCLKTDFSAFALVYFLSYWFWITYIAGKSVRHPLSNKFYKIIVEINTVLSIITVLTVMLIIFLSISDLTRMYLAYFGIFSIVVYIYPTIFIISICGHIYITSKNILTINSSQNKISLILGLLIYPIGIWTIQETLKCKLSQ